MIDDAAVNLLQYTHYNVFSPSPKTTQKIHKEYHNDWL